HHALCSFPTRRSSDLDAAGTLYATWDTQGTNSDGTANDIGWLSWSTDHGQHWSSPVQATSDTLNFPHIMEVTGAGSGVAYVAWRSEEHTSELQSRENL